MKQKFVVIGMVFITYITKPMVLLGQIQHPGHWSYAAKKTNSREAEIFIKAAIDKGWRVYATDQPDGGPVKTSVTFEPSQNYKLVNGIIQPTAIIVFEDAFKMNVRYFEGAVIFHQKVMLSFKDAVIRGKVTFMVCNNQKRVPPDEVNFSIPVK